MKIFSLQSKTGLVAWSVVLGLLVSLTLYIVSQISINVTVNCIPQPGLGCLDDLGGYTKKVDYGWPIKYHAYNLTYDYSISVFYIILDKYSFVLNSFFWIAVVFYILRIVRYFRKKDNQLPSKLN